MPTAAATAGSQANCNPSTVGGGGHSGTTLNTGPGSGGSHAHRATRKPHANRASRARTTTPSHTSSCQRRFYPHHSDPRFPAPARKPTGYTSYVLVLRFMYLVVTKSTTGTAPERVPGSPTGEWPSGKAPDSGSGDRRFKSFLASHPSERETAPGSLPASRSTSDQRSASSSPWRNPVRSRSHTEDRGGPLHGSDERPDLFDRQRMQLVPDLRRRLDQGRDVAGDSPVLRARPREIRRTARAYRIVEVDRSPRRLSASSIRATSDGSRRAKGSRPMVGRM